MKEISRNQLTPLEDPVGAVMVVGAGIGGIQASLDLAEAGYKVYLVEKKSAIGGKMARLDKTFPTNDCAMCILSPKLVDCGRHLNIEIITGAEINNIRGEAGDFNVSLTSETSFVDLEECTSCGDCADVCPVELPDDFNEDLNERKAAYKLYPQAIPNAYHIEKRGIPPCREACPAGCNVQGYTALISEGEFAEALDVIRRDIPFPGICGRICHHPCEDECNRQDFDDPVSVANLKRAASDFGREEEREIEVPDVEDREVAIVGAGPAGLTAALDLRKMGHGVKVFDRQPEPGGALYTYVPRYRMGEDVLKQDTEYIMAHDIDFEGNTEVGKDIALNSLQEEYDAVLLAVGATEPRTLDVPGSELEGVEEGLDFIKDVNLGREVSVEEKVAVIGGGNVAIDTARTALREGAEEVHIACLEDREEMPAHEWEIQEALEEGAYIHPGLGPKKFLDDGEGGVEAVEFLQVDSVFDEEGNFNPSFIEGSETSMQVDMILVAIGQQPEISSLDRESFALDSDGTIAVDPLTKAADKEGIFACGDAVSGPASVVEAIAGGHEAAESIRRYLAGEDLAEDREKEEEYDLDAPEVAVETKRRLIEESEPARERIQDYREVNRGLSREKAREEAERCLNCALCSECLQCVESCEAECIDHDMEDEDLEINVGSVILNPGNDLFQAEAKGEFGYGRYDNVVTSIEFERMLSASGPFEGEILRPSDGRHPEKVAFIQCVGSRDYSCEQDYCSSVCCMYSTKEAVIAREHQPGLEAKIFYMDIRAYGKGFEDYYERAEEEYGIDFCRSRISRVVELQQSKDLRLKYYDQVGDVQEEDFDMVVLSTGLTPPEEVEDLASAAGVKVNDHGFCATGEFLPNQTTREGIFVSGTFSEPKDIPETVTDSSGAAARASEMLSSARNTLTEEKEYPPEKELGDELRIGVFICHCGINIGGVVDVPAVVEAAEKLDDVVVAEENLYTCSQDSLDLIKEAIEEEDLNRVIVASCTPRTHEPLYQDTVREAGLNPYLFEMTNIREQASWVHQNNPEAATEKAKDLVHMAVNRARKKEPLYTSTFDIDEEALVIGGGLAGMVSALSLARQGYPVHLVEREEKLGGNMRQIHSTLTGEETPLNYLRELHKKLDANENVNVYCNAEIKSIDGYVGNYSTAVNLDGGEKEIEHGVILVATGAREMEPQKYGYGVSPAVVTQREFEEEIHEEGLQQDGAAYAMIQCVGSRTDENPYCSRVCCGEAIKNALEIKERDPTADVFIFYRDMRTYGFKEEYYRRAREKGIVFINYEPEKEPEVNADDDAVKISHLDPALNEEVKLEVDRLILSSGIEPVDNKDLAQMLKIPGDSNGFFLEAHTKLRPVDFATEGIFLCGLAHSPKDLSETVTQARAAAMRAVTILAQGELESTGIVATVKERICTACGVCVEICPYDAKEIDEDKQVARVNEALCQGCGACAAGCPSGASRHKGFQKQEIMAMLEASI